MSNTDECKCDCPHCKDIKICKELNICNCSTPNKVNYPKRIILIRHGESQGNIDTSLYQRMADWKIPLTDNGIQQATTLGKKLKNLVKNESCKFYISPYKRSRQTFDHIIKSFPDPKQYSFDEDPRIREQEWSNFQTETVSQTIKERRNFGTFFYRFNNGESGADVFDRVSLFIDSVFRYIKRKKVDNVILVCHGMSLRLFLMRYYKWDVDFFHCLYNPDNAQFTIMESRDDTYKITTPLKIGAAPSNPTATPDIIPPEYRNLFEWIKV